MSAVSVFAERIPCAVCGEPTRSRYYTGGQALACCERPDSRTKGACQEALDRNAAEWQPGACWGCGSPTFWRVVRVGKKEAVWYEAPCGHPCITTGKKARCAKRCAS